MKNQQNQESRFFSKMEGITQNQESTTNKNQESSRTSLFSKNQESKQPHYPHHYPHDHHHGEAQSSLSLEEGNQEIQCRLSSRNKNYKNGGGDQECSGSERLKRHRNEVAGSVWIPEIWGQEELLKDWIDCSAFEASLVPQNIMSARSALVQEGRKANSSSLRIEN